MIILFDIDNTLINTVELKKIFAKKLIKICNTDSLTLNKFENEFIQKINGSNNIDIHLYIKNIVHNFNCSLDELYKLYIQNKKVYQSVLFKETKNTLQELSKEHTLGIYSEGNSFFQTVKLKNSGIYNYFSRKHIYIFIKKLTQENISILPKKSLIIDDKEEVVNQLKKLNYQTVHFTSYSKLKSSLDCLF